MWQRTVKPGDWVRIGDVTVRLLRTGRKLRLRIDAPADVLIEYRAASAPDPQRDSAAAMQGGG